MHSTSNSSPARSGGRPADALRPVVIQLSPLKYAEGSALIEMGDTRVLVAASIEKRVPPFLIGSGRGWLTAEYAMLPRATSTRNAREVTKGRPAGRSAEIQRLIGRSLRAAVRFEDLGEMTLTLDCDVLQADGGTRTAAITGAYVATVLALARLYLTGDLQRWPLQSQIAAISVGLVGGAALLDLDSAEDQAAEVDMNVVATADERIVEVQGTGERRSFERRELDALIDLALGGIRALAAEQNRVLGPVLEEVQAVQQKGRRRSAPPKDERALWGRPDGA
ncbi:MAG: ribonuclease PH [Acidobacteriota bacterium]